MEKELLQNILTIVTNTEESVTGLHEEVKELKTKMNNIEVRVGGIENKIGRMEETIEKDIVFYYNRESGRSSTASDEEIIAARTEDLYNK